MEEHLKQLMQQTANRDKHIVNVSAMEGVFYRAYKRDTHPHTNMAKAALKSGMKPLDRQDDDDLKTVAEEQTWKP